MTVKGWCPGAHRPMMSGDGLIIRVRPRLGRMTADQVLGLCAVAQEFGNGTIDLTSRANLQLRGVSEDAHQQVLEALLPLGLLDETPAQESRRNLTITPHWQVGDINQHLHDSLCEQIGDMPDLPAKMGVAIDAGPRPVLQGTPADFRFEAGVGTDLILRLDGLTLGRAIAPETAVSALIEAAQWFVSSDGFASKRMAQHVKHCPPPDQWCVHAPAAPDIALLPGPMAQGIAYGAAFGSLDAFALSDLVADSQATAMRVTPWRVFVLEDAQPAVAQGFVTEARDPILSAHACPGAPACEAATVDTRMLARALAPLHPNGLHVSGCAKGCAHPKSCATTLVGQNGAFDLVEHGHPWDQPRQRGLSATEILRAPTPDQLMMLKA
ncbi:MAG: cobalamin biosynthesis protein CobG [Tateyamaria sp.]|uniref:cobalamin biosynthesis protein CobG n=1 Tax=Tateyamaria sp. TaxID=1929288 RepID=UPI00328B7BD7